MGSNPVLNSSVYNMHETWNWCLIDSRCTICGDYVVVNTGNYLPISSPYSMASFFFSAKLSAVLIGIIDFVTVLQIVWVMPPTQVSSHIFFLLANTVGNVGCCVPLLTAGFVLFRCYIHKLLEMLYFKTVSHILHFASVVFQFNVFSHRTLFWQLNFVCVFYFFFSFMLTQTLILFCFGAFWSRHAVTSYVWLVGH